MNVNGKNKETLGLLLEKPDQLNYLSQKENTPEHIHSLNDYFHALYQTAIDRPNPDGDDLKRTIVISDLGLSGRIRKLPERTILQLVESGRLGVRKFVKE